MKCPSFFMRMMCSLVLYKRGIVAVVLALVPVGQMLLCHRDTHPVIDGVFGLSIVVC